MRPINDNKNVRILIRLWLRLVNIYCRWLLTTMLWSFQAFSNITAIITLFLLLGGDGYSMIAENKTAHYQVKYASRYNNNYQWNSHSSGGFLVHEPVIPGGIYHSSSGLLVHEVVVVPAESPFIPSYRGLPHSR
jgi:hypothetical protein